MSRSILFISTMNGDPWGGSEEFWFHLSRWMASQGFRVGCSFFEWPAGKQDKIRQLEEAGCQVYPIPNPKSATNPFQKMMIRKRGYGYLKKLCAQDWSIVCISQGGYEDVTHRPFRFLYKDLQKFALVYHNYNETHRLSAKRIANLNHWINKALLNMGDASRIFDGMKKITGLEVPRSFVLNNPLTIPYQPGISPWPSNDPDGNYVFTMLAQLDISRKAQDVLIEALSTAKWKERNWVLYLYGKGDDREKLSQLIASLNLEGKIKLMGHTTDVHSALEKTHLLFQITHIDAMPLSVTEAMNMARPCVVSAVGDMPRWITPGKNGYIAASVTVAAIREILEQAWQDRDGWQQKGQESHAIFVKKYPQPYEKYYAELLLNL
jgi:glycosyltransferase involved in cell wall biosynthesis